MKKGKIYLVIFYLVLLVIVISMIRDAIYSSKDLYHLFAEFFMLAFSITALIRAYKLENYLLLLDKQPTITYFQHYKGMVIALWNANVNKPLVLYMLIKPIFKKGDFESHRKQVNMYTYLTYVFLICGIIFLNIE
jgi:hypothetical protein